METCLYGMNSLFNNGPSLDLVEKEVIRDTKDLSFSIDKITLVKILDNYTCDVITKDSNGFRSYRVTLKRNSKFKHLYKIGNVTGQKIISKYQWRNL